MDDDKKLKQWMWALCLTVFASGMAGVLFGGYLWHLGDVAYINQRLKDTESSLESHHIQLTVHTVPGQICHGSTPCMYFDTFSFVEVSGKVCKLYKQEFLTKSNQIPVDTIDCDLLPREEGRKR